MIAASVALRHIGPMWSSEAASSKQPKRETRPQVGFNPVLPLAADGKRIDPPVSEPSEPKHRPAAVATPEPLDDAPDQWSRCQGLSGAAIVGMVVGERALGELELAEQDGAGLAQLAHDGRIDGGTKSRCSGMPAAVAIPSVQHRSLTAIGTPCSCDRIWRRPIICSAARACASASSGVTSAYDFSAGSTRSIRRSMSSVSSTGESLRAAIRRASSSISR